MANFVFAAATLVAVFQPIISVFIPLCAPDTTITRKLELTGFHRLLSYSVEIVHSGDWADCTFCVQETVPPGLYLNPDELASLKKFNNVSAFFSDRPNIEAPRSLSKPFKVALCSSLESDSNLLFTDFSTPLHLRYHNARPSGGFEKVRLNIPKAFIYCSTQPKCLDLFSEFPCPGKETAECKYQDLKYKMNGKEIELEVPVGKTDDFSLVFGVTLALVYTGAIYIIIGAFMNKKD